MTTEPDPTKSEEKPQEATIESLTEQYNLLANAYNDLEKEKLKLEVLLTRSVSIAKDLANQLENLRKDKNNSRWRR